MACPFNKINKHHIISHLSALTSHRPRTYIHKDEVVGTLYTIHPYFKLVLWGDKGWVERHILPQGAGRQCRHPSTAWLLLSKYNNLISLAVNKQASVGVAAIGSPVDQWQQSNLAGRRLSRSVDPNTILVRALGKEGAPSVQYRTVFLKTSLRCPPDFEYVHFVWHYL